MIVGFVFSMTLLLQLIISKRKLTLAGFVLAFYLLLGFLGGQLLFLGYYGSDPIFPWLGFVVFPIVMTLAALYARRVIGRQY